MPLTNRQKIKKYCLLTVQWAAVDRTVLESP